MKMVTEAGVQSTESCETFNPSYASDTSFVITTFSEAASRVATGLSTSSQKIPDPTTFTKSLLSSMPGIASRRACDKTVVKYSL
jgi:hypothetical protein